MISYEKLIQIFKERKITSYTMKNEKILGQATWQAIKQGKGGLDHRSINRLCAYLGCQPGDLMEYVPDPVEPEPNPGEEDNQQG